MKDFLGRDLQVGDHVVWGAGGRGTAGIRRGYISLLIPATGNDPHSDRVRTTKAAGSYGHGQETWAHSVVKVDPPEGA